MTNSGYGGYGKADPELKQLWAHMPFLGKKVHYWHRKENGVVLSACNLVSAETNAIKLLNPGNGPRCKNCARKLKL
jgi:hypothetical protein